MVSWAVTHVSAALDDVIVGGIFEAFVAAFVALCRHTHRQRVLPDG